MNSFGHLVEDLSVLGKAMEEAARAPEDSESDLAGAIVQAGFHNSWFNPHFTRFAFSAWARALVAEKIALWLDPYRSELAIQIEPQTVGLIMAGNIPMVGLHDLICVLASGHRALVRLSSADQILIPGIIETLVKINPAFKGRVSFADGLLKNFDAVIATGSNNSSRYFDYYFGKYPNIVRKNRNGVAVLTGNESEEELAGLADDIFMYFGLGCRNVSKLYLPEGFEITNLLPFFNNYQYLADLHKYRNNYDYQKSILLINRIPHYDNGFLLLKPDLSLITPISVVNYETYQSPDQLMNHLESIKDQVQCVVSVERNIEAAIMPGQSQFPELWDYADGVDVMNFLLSLKKTG